VSYTIEDLLLDFIKKALANKIPPISNVIPMYFKYFMFIC